MKIIILLSAIILVSSFVHAQATSPSAARYLFESDTTASTSWDSIAVGNSSSDKAIEICNDGSVSLYVAIGNDTTNTNNSNHQYLTVKTGERQFIGRVRDVNFIRTKSASSTCQRRIKRWMY